MILYLMKKDGLVFSVQLTCCNFALVMALKVLLQLTGLLVLLGIGLSLMYGIILRIIGHSQA